LNLTCSKVVLQTAQPQRPCALQVSHVNKHRRDGCSAQCVHNTISDACIVHLMRCLSKLEFPALYSVTSGLALMHCQWSAAAGVTHILYLRCKCAALPPVVSIAVCQGCAHNGCAASCIRCTSMSHHFQNFFPVVAEQSAAISDGVDHPALVDCESASHIYVPQYMCEPASHTFVSQYKLNAAWCIVVFHLLVVEGFIHLQSEGHWCETDSRCHGVLASVGLPCYMATCRTHNSQLDSINFAMLTTRCRTHSDQLASADITMHTVTTSTAGGGCMQLCAAVSQKEASWVDPPGKPHALACKH
jgi:hypothetical protein